MEAIHSYSNRHSGGSGQKDLQWLIHEHEGLRLITYSCRHDGFDQYRQEARGTESERLFAHIG